MEYNVALHSLAESNTTEGTVDLSTDELISIVRNEGNITVSGSSTVCLDFDLGTRIHLSEIRYYFTSTVASGIIASNLAFYVKDDAADSYVSLATMVGASYYYAVASGTSILSPRYIRVKQTTTASGYINGFEAYNDDNIVDFGSNGDQTEENFDMALLGAATEVRALEIYNDGTLVSDAYAMLEYKGDITDEIFSLGASEDGPWKSPTDNAIESGDTWSEGSTFQISFDSDGTLIVEPGKSYGIYTGNIFSKPEESTFSSLVVVYNDEVLPQTIEFEDHFNDAAESATKWEVSNSNWDFTGGYLNINGTYEWAQTNTFTLNYDFDISFRFRHTGSSDGSEVQTRFYSYPSGALNFYAKIRRESGNGYRIMFYVNGSNVHNSSWIYDSNWRWVRIRRFFGTLYYRWWWNGDPEPASWYWSGNPNTYDSSYKIYLYTLATNNFWDDFTVISNYTVSGTIDSYPKIAVDADDVNLTIEKRSSNIKPKNYDTYTECVDSGSTIVLKEYLVDSDALLSTSADLKSSGSHQAEQGWNDTDARIAIDKYTNRRAVIFKWHHSHNYAYDIMNISIVEPSGSVTTLELTDDKINTDLYAYFIDLDVAGGVWFYAYPYNIDSKAGEYFNTANEFYLCYLNNSLATSDAGGTFCKIQAEEGFIYDAALTYETSELWYTDPTAQAVIKIDKYGNILSSFSTTDNVRGITTTSDYGCYYIEDQGIFKLNQQGLLVDAIYPSGVVDLSRIAVDRDDSGFLWITDASYIKKIRVSDGYTVFSLQLPYSATEIQPMIGGCAVFCTDRIWRFIDNTPRIYKTHDPGTTETYRKVLSVDHENEVYNSEFPISSDTHWNNLQWKKFAPAYYNLSNESYHQLRITLRTNEDLYTPKLQYVYLQDAVKVENISPGSYKNVYLKADISSLTDDDAGDHEADLKVWWNIPV